MRSGGPRPTDEREPESLSVDDYERLSREHPEQMPDLTRRLVLDFVAEVRRKVGRLERPEDGEGD